MLQLKPQLFEALDTPEGLQRALQQAVALEHSTIPTYLYALYSLKPGSNGEIRNLIASVVIEEMSHMALACNILNAIGGSPLIDDPRFIPRYPGPLPGGVESQLVVPLQRFSPQLVHDVFMEIEEPEDPPDIPVVAAAAVPQRTIGQFYTEIDGRIAAFGKSIFTGDPALQVTGVFASIGLIAVDGVESAHHAIETIVEQGEGTKQSPLDPEHELAHYYKFAEIFHGRKLIEKPGAPPDAPLEERYVFGGDPIPFDPAGVHPLVANPKLSDYPAGSRAHFACNAFNYTYTSVLKTLHATFNGDPDALPAAIGLMESLKDQAMEIVEIAVGPAGNAGPSFEYQPVSA